MTAKRVPPKSEASKEKSVDWRTLPRVPAERKKSRVVTFKVTEAEFEALHAAAATAGQTLTAFIAQRALRGLAGN